MSPPHERIFPCQRSENDPKGRGADEGQGRQREGSSGLGEGREEAYGPLVLRRYLKGDGRGLILYTHEDSAHAEPANG
ncbi:MAG: hypothetical protein ACRDK7_04150 [Solirubrobacteraceae bacterium]